MERLYHVTTARNLVRIRRDGHLDPMKARGTMKVTWFVPSRLVSWAIAHVQLKHGCSIGSVRIIDFRGHLPATSEHAGSHKFFRKSLTGLNGVVIWTAEDWVGDEDTLPDYPECPEGVKVGG